MQNQPDVQKSVLITGCSSGIGRATAEYLAKNGFTVFATVRKETDYESLSRLLNPNLIPICPFDLTRLDGIPHVVETVQAELQRRGQPGLYAFISNAGGGEVAPIELMDVDVFHRELQTRLVGPVALLQALLPSLRRGAGRILWIMTPAAIPTPYVTSIHACDFAANCIVRTLDIELKSWHMPVVQIRCGGIKTSTGMNTNALVDAIMQHPRGSLYRDALQKWATDISAFDQKRTPAEKVAEVVLAALRASKPKRSYSIGHMAGAAAFLESLPQALTDTILRMRF